MTIRNSERKSLFIRLTKNLLGIYQVLGAFLTAMTFHSIRVELYMTKISFLTAFFFVRLRVPKIPCMIPRGAIFN
jgi:hypothetical protein